MNAVARLGCKKNRFRFFNILSVIFLTSLLSIISIFSLWKANEGIGDTDTAFFLDVIKNTVVVGIPTTNMVRAFLDVWPLLDMPLSRYCTLDFSLVPSSEPANILRGHANFIVYPLSAISYLVGTEVAAALANTLSFALLPIISFAYLRKAKVAPLLCFLFILIVCTHPAWRISLAGGFYFDRLFMPVGLWYALALYGPFSRGQPFTTSNMVGIIVLLVLGASIHERAALLLLIFSILNLALFRDIPRKNFILVAWIILILTVYIISYMLFQTNVDQKSIYYSFLKFDEFIGNINRPGLIKLIFFNLVFLSAAIFFEWRVALIAALMVLPNVIVTIGGAEKDGWSTHYHSFYFPFVLYAGVVGLIKLYDWLSHRAVTRGQKYRYNFYTVTFLFLVGFSMCFQNPYGKTIRWSMQYAAEGAGYYFYDLYIKSPATSSNRYIAKRSDNLVSNIPRGASISVSVPFDFWKLIRNDNVISLFPAGLGKSEYLLVAFSNNANGTRSFGVTRFLPDQESAQQCITERVWAEGYSIVSIFDHFMILRKSI